MLSSKIVLKNNSSYLGRGDWVLSMYYFLILLLYTILEQKINNWKKEVLV